MPTFCTGREIASNTSALVRGGGNNYIAVGFKSNCEVIMFLGIPTSYSTNRIIVSWCERPLMLLFRCCSCYSWGIFSSSSSRKNSRKSLRWKNIKLATDVLQETLSIIVRRSAFGNVQFALLGLSVRPYVPFSVCLKIKFYK